MRYLKLLGRSFASTLVAAGAVAIMAAQVQADPAVSPAKGNSGPVKVHGPDIKHPGLMAVPLNRFKVCPFLVTPVEGSRAIDPPNAACPPPPTPTLCLAAERHCLNPSMPAGRMIPL